MRLLLADEGVWTKIVRAPESKSHLAADVPARART